MTSTCKSRLVPAVIAGVTLTISQPLALKPVLAETTALQAPGAPSLAPLIERVAPAVVNVSVKSKADAGMVGSQKVPEEFRRFFNFPGLDDNDEGAHPRKMPDRKATGSGVIVDAKKGYILTNYHVIDRATDIAVALKDRREFTAKLIGGDKDTDVALLKIDADNLTALPVGDSSTVKVGDYVVAVGNPFGLGQTVTSGIVSAVGRSGLSIEGYEDFIQTDAAINPGNSGGALVNMKGELVGINTAIVGSSGGNVGIGFAVPANMANSVMTQLAKYGEVKRGRIGVQIRDMTPELAKNLNSDQMIGAVIGEVMKDSPAEHAGLKTGDIVIAVNGSPLLSASDLRNRVGLMPLGEKAHMTVVRDGRKMELTVAIEKAPDAIKTAAVMQRPTLEGATFESREGAQKAEGVEVTAVERDSPAWRVGLRPNDGVVAVNRKPVTSLDQLDGALTKSQRQAALFIKRSGEDVLIIV
jgi:serine protease DegQ